MIEIKKLLARMKHGKKCNWSDQLKDKVKELTTTENEENNCVLLTFVRYKIIANYMKKKKKKEKIDGEIPKY